MKWLMKYALLNIFCHVHVYRRIFSSSAVNNSTCPIKRFLLFIENEARVCLKISSATPHNVINLLNGRYIYSREGLLLLTCLVSAARSGVCACNNEGPIGYMRIALLSSTSQYRQILLSEFCFCHSSGSNLHAGCGAGNFTLGIVSNIKLLLST